MEVYIYRSLFFSWILLLLFHSISGMLVDLYVHKDKFGQSLQLDISEKSCTNVPKSWVNFTRSIDTHGSCMQFYDKRSCKGRVAVIQPFHSVHQMDLSLIEFDNVIQSISPCGPKVPNGRYVIQSAMDASLLTVTKNPGSFATVKTFPPRPFIPKSQQWIINEKNPNEYDVMPRMHEQNHPVTYDTKAMTKGSFIRKTWKLESVGRGRYIFKSEWTKKCLYKTRIRTIEEHDCQAWSPNQEWILRPLLVPKEIPPKTEKQKLEDLPGNVIFSVPSKAASSKDSEEASASFETESFEDIGDDGNSGSSSEETSKLGAHLGPYKVRKRSEDKENSKKSKKSKKQEGNRRPPLFYREPPHPSMLHRGRPAPKVRVAYINGAYPMFRDDPIEDPVFPDFLMKAVHDPIGHKSQHYNEEDEAEASDEDELKSYVVTRKPTNIPLPVGHENFVAPKPKYDTRVAAQYYKKKREQELRDQEPSSESSESSESQEYDAPPPPYGYRNIPEEKIKQGKNKESNKLPKSPAHIDPSENPLNSYGTEVYRGFEGKIEIPGSPRREKIKPEPKSSSSEEVESDESEEEESNSKPTAYNDESDVPSEELSYDDEPATDVAGFMKLLFKGIVNKMSSHDDKEEEEMISIF